MNTAFYGTYMLTRREIARYANVWAQTVIPPVVSAILFLFVFGHALGNRIQDFDGVPYLSFIVPGLIVQGAITNSFANTGSSLFDSRRAGYIDDVLTSPLKDWQIVLAYMLSGMSRGFIIGMLTLAIGLLAATGWDIQWGLFLVVLTLSCAAFALIGLLIGLRASRWDHVFVPQTFLITPLVFLGGVFYPTSLLSPRMEAVSRFNPILYIVDAARHSLLGVHELPVAPSIVGLLVLTVVLYAVVLQRFSTSPKLRG